MTTSHIHCHISSIDEDKAVGNTYQTYQLDTLPIDEQDGKQGQPLSGLLRRTGEHLSKHKDCSVANDCVGYQLYPSLLGIYTLHYTNLWFPHSNIVVHEPGLTCMIQIDDGWNVYCYMADCGQEEDFKAAQAKAAKIGAKDCFVDDVKEEFVKELVFPAIQCNAIYESTYLLGTSLARPVIARGMMKYAKKQGCVAVSHGCTGKGNDQVRFELAFLAISPSTKIIAPWRDPVFYNRFPGREALLEYAAATGIPVSSTKSKPWSMDENLAHCSYEAGILEDPNTTPPTDMWKLTQDPTKAPDTPEDFTVTFEKGIPVKLVTQEKTITEPVELFTEANTIARRHGVGRIDIVENRFIGMQSLDALERQH